MREKILEVKTWWLRQLLRIDHEQQCRKRFFINCKWLKLIFGLKKVKIEQFRLISSSNSLRRLSISNINRYRCILMIQRFMHQLIGIPNCPQDRAPRTRWRINASMPGYLKACIDVGGRGIKHLSSNSRAFQRGF